jgi:hypothetical protein
MPPLAGNSEGGHEESTQFENRKRAARHFRPFQLKRCDGLGSGPLSPPYASIVDMNSRKKLPTDLMAGQLALSIRTRLQHTSLDP